MNLIEGEEKVTKIAKISFIIILLMDLGGLFACNYENNTAPILVPPTSGATAPSGPIIIEISIPYAPALNQPVSVTGTVSSIYDIKDLTITISTRRLVIAPHGMDIEQPFIAGDDTTQTFNLKANQPVSFSSQIVFKETGFWSIDARASGYAPIYDKYWGDDASLSLTVNTDNGVMGWSLPEPPEYPKPPKPSPEPPPAVMPNNT
jgi:hypothetical protein